MLWHAIVYNDGKLTAINATINLPGTTKKGEQNAAAYRHSSEGKFEVFSLTLMFNF